MKSLMNTISIFLSLCRIHFFVRQTCYSTTHEANNNQLSILIGTPDVTAVAKRSSELIEIMDLKLQAADFSLMGRVRVMSHFSRH